jgi:hypothetical protein
MTGVAIDYPFDTSALLSAGFAKSLPHSTAIVKIRKQFLSK